MMLITDEIRRLAQLAQMGAGELNSSCMMWEEQYGKAWQEKALELLKERVRVMKGVRPLIINDSGDAIRA